jgi:23S rRNA (uracil1939-C5)-methyltransferase
VVDIDDFDSEQRLQTKRATYKDIQKWVRDKYGEHVTNLDISRTKKLCGLAQNEYRGREAAAGYYVPKPREKKQEMVIEAFKYFGIIGEGE